MRSARAPNFLSCQTKAMLFTRHPSGLYGWTLIDYCDFDAAIAHYRTKNARIAYVFHAQSIG